MKTRLEHMNRWCSLRASSTVERVPRRSAPSGATASDAPPEAALGDSVDRIVAEWARERPDLPVAPVEVLTRLARVRTHLDEELAGLFAEYDLSAADFTVIAALRRAGEPYTLPQSVLMARLSLTSGTVSVRLGRLETKGVVSRAPASTDARGVQVTLTPRGLELFDQVAPRHLDNEDVLLSALDEHDRHQLSGLLRKLLVSFEHPQHHSPLGVTLAPAHLARRARRDVGLSDTAGLLVRHVHPGTPAADAGLRPGDLLLEADDEPLRSCVDLGERTAGATTAGRPLHLRVLRGQEERHADLEVPEPP
jgi:DNA-binding MarR family transcriptional regulator